MLAAAGTSGSRGPSRTDRAGAPCSLQIGNAPQAVTTSPRCGVLGRSAGLISISSMLATAPASMRSRMRRTTVIVNGTPTGLPACSDWYSTGSPKAFCRMLFTSALIANQSDMGFHGEKRGGMAAAPSTETRGANRRELLERHDGVEHCHDHDAVAGGERRRAVGDIQPGGNRRLYDG